MKVIIIGCGRLGLGLAKALDKKGTDVTLIDKNPDMFKSLSAKFSGKILEGIGFDKTVLEAAGITMADAVVACTESDETNALIALFANV